MTFAILYFLNTVPSVDSSIPVTIQAVFTHNIMLNITVFVNVRKCKKIFVHSYYSVFITFPHSPQNTLYCVNNMLNRNASVGI